MVRPINTASTMLLLVLLLSVSYVRAIHWQHAQQLSDDFRLLWSISDDATDITFEMQARTHGYIGLGLTRPGDHTAGADLVIGWVDNGQTYLQVNATHVSAARVRMFDIGHTHTSRRLITSEHINNTQTRCRRNEATIGHKYENKITHHDVVVVLASVLV